MVDVYYNLIKKCLSVEFQNVVYVKTPEGQVSWHIPINELHLFNFLEVRDKNKYDGHTTSEKYGRLRRLTTTQLEYPNKNCLDERKKCIM